MRNIYACNKCYTFIVRTYNTQVPTINSRSQKLFEKKRKKICCFFSYFKFESQHTLYKILSVQFVPSFEPGGKLENRRSFHQMFPMEY